MKHFALTAQWEALVPVSAEFESLRQGSLPILWTEDPSLPPSGYRLTIQADRVTSSSADAPGAFYSLCTLEQLSLQNEGRVRCCTIEDAPEMAVRGYSDDISRGQISTLDDFKSIIRRLARLKCNLYMPYIEDTLAFSSIPEFGKYSDPVPPEEWRELEEYAAGYYVEIVPILNILGHWDKNGTLQAFSRYMLKGEDGLPLHAVDVRKPQTVQLAETMLREASEVFPKARCIHVGGDEAAEYTRLFPKEEASRLYCGYFRHAHDYLEGLGFHTMMYSDMFTPVWGDYHLGIDAIQEIPDGVGFLYWDYAPRRSYPNVLALSERSRPFCVSPATFTWNRFLPHYEIAWENISALAAASRGKAQGMVVSSWCDGGMTLREENWFGIAVHADFSWNPDCGDTFPSLLKTFFSVFYGLDSTTASAALRALEYDRPLLTPYQEEGGQPVEFWFSGWQEIGERLCREFWKDASLDPDLSLRGRADDIAAALEEGIRVLSSVRPVRNQTAYECFLFDIKRSLAAIRKCRVLKSGPYLSREEAREAVPALESLKIEIQGLLEENKRLWFLTNRQSEWNYVEAKYQDLLDSFSSLIRYCRYGKTLKVPKKL